MYNARSSTPPINRMRITPSQPQQQAARNHELGIFQPNLQITIPHDALQVSSARPSHNYALQQAHETLRLDTYDLGTKTVARLRKQKSTIRHNGPRSSAKRLRRTRDTRRDETNGACQHSKNRRVIARGCTRHSTAHASYRASGKVLGGLSLFQSRNSLDSLKAGHVGRGDLQLLCPAERYGPRERRRRAADREWRSCYFVVISDRRPWP
jgi:hypothetical protein